MTRTISVLALVLALAGCRVTDKAINTAQAAAASNDRYTTLTLKAFAGESSLAIDGIAPVSSTDLAETPAPVQGLISRLLEALHANRFASHGILFQLNEGPDPKTLKLTPVQLPEDDLFKDD